MGVAAAAVGGRTGGGGEACDASVPTDSRLDPGHSQRRGGGGFSACYLVLCATIELNYSPITSKVLQRRDFVPSLFSFLYFFISLFLNCGGAGDGSAALRFSRFSAVAGRTVVWIVYNTANQSQLASPPPPPPTPAASPNPARLCTECYSEAP